MPEQLTAAQDGAIDRMRDALGEYHEAGGALIDLPADAEPRARRRRMEQFIAARAQAEAAYEDAKRVFPYIGA